jgi:hypothetical protein
MAQIGMANRSALGRITLGCATLEIQGESSCCGVLLAASYCRRLVSSAAQCFSAKFIADCDSLSIWFTDSGFCSKSQPYSYRDSEGTDAHQSQPYSESNSNSDRHADTNAARLSQSEGLADANASTWIPLAALDCFLTRSDYRCRPKQNPPAFTDGFWLITDYGFSCCRAALHRSFLRHHPPGGRTVDRLQGKPQ